MGWCSITALFDELALCILAYDHMGDEEREDLLAAIIHSLRSMDWDCEEDSAYAENEIVRRALDRAR